MDMDNTNDLQIRTMDGGKSYFGKDDLGNFIDMDFTGEDSIAIFTNSDAVFYFSSRNQLLEFVTALMRMGGKVFKEDFDDIVEEIEAYVNY